MTSTRRKAKKRERPLAAAIGFGLLVTFGVALAIFVAMMLIPGTALHYFFQMSLNQSSATLPFDPLFQQWKEDVNREDALFVTPLSLLSGGLILGWLAPQYATRRRILRAAAAMALGVSVVFLAFTWTDAIISTNTIAAHEGGYVARLTAPLGYILLQAAWVAAWVAVCVLGAWLGVRLRDRRSPQGNDAAPALRATPR